MRTISDITRLKITAPDASAHKQDNNIITVTRKTSAASTTFTLQIVVGATTKTYTATTDGKVIRWDMSEYFRTLDGGTQITITILEGEDTTSPVATFDASLTLYDGVTIPGRERGSETVIVLAKSDSCELWMRGKATVRNGNPPETEDTEYTGDEGLFTIDPAGYSVLVVDYVDNHTFGTAWDSETTNRRRIKFLSPCTAAGYLTLSYTNADGCGRFACGKVLNHTYTATQVEYVDNKSEVHNAARRYVDSLAETIEVGFADVDPGQLLEDIMLCDTVGVYEKDLTLIPTTLTVTRDGKTKDIVITFKLR